MSKAKTVTKKFVSFFSGDFIISRGLNRQLGFIFYIFVLICVMIAWSLMVESRLVKVRANDKTIESLVIASDQRSIELLSIDRRSRVEEMLKKNKSNLVAPVEPAKLLENK